MMPGKYNMICAQGATFSKRLTWSIDGDPVDLTGYTAEMQAREKYSSPNAIFTLSTGDGSITLDSQGNIDLLIDSSDTENIVAKEYVYDLELNSGAEVYRIIEGKFIVTPEVTRT